MNIGIVNQFLDWTCVTLWTFATAKNVLANPDQPGKIYTLVAWTIFVTALLSNAGTG